MSLRGLLGREGGHWHAWGWSRSRSGRRHGRGWLTGPEGSCLGYRLLLRLLLRELLRWGLNPVTRLGSSGSRRRHGSRR